MTTLGQQDQARALAQDLVTAQLAACVNILPKMQSIYRWQGKLEQGDEYLLLIKTRAERVDSVIHAIKANHPYELRKSSQSQLTAVFLPT